MVSPNKAGFNLRETMPLSRNNLHTCGVVAHESTGQRMSPMTGYRDWIPSTTSPKDEAGHLVYLASIRDSAKSGMGCTGNRHLSYLAESISVNVGDSPQAVKTSSPSMPSPNEAVRVGAIIVL
jgi:hypothetical protein